MERVYECIGRKANNPFYLDKIRCNVFSAEELIYSIYQNAELLEKNVFSQELVLWLEKECGAKNLAEKLYRLLSKGAGLVPCVEALLDELDLIESGKKRDFLAMLEESGGEETVTKRKKRADYFLGKGRFFHAIKEYESLLEEVEEQETFMRGDIYHRMGIAKANLFLFEEAERDFYRAYEMDESEEHFYYYAACMRIRMTDSEYVRKVSENPLMSRVTLRLESAVKEAGTLWSEGEEKAFMDKKAEKQQEGTAQYEAWIAGELAKKKDAYRRTVR